MTDDMWPKLAALIMRKLDCDHLVITLEDVEDFPAGMVIVVTEKRSGLHIELESRQ